MNRENRLNFCKVCIRRKNDLHKGLVCGLTDTYADFDFSCLNYKEDNLLVNKEKEIQLNRKSKGSNSNRYIGIIIGVIFSLFALIRLGYNIVKLKDNSNKEILNKKNNDRNKISKRQLVKNQPKAITYLASADRIAIRRKRVSIDTSFMVSKFLQVTIHKKYYMSIIEDDKLPVLAISRGYCFIHNKVKSNNSKSLSKQWIDLRKSFSPDFSFVLTKKHAVEGMKIEEYNFIIPGHRNVYGVAKLFEIGNERFFFHFAFKQQTPDYNMLNRYLNYYVKIK